MIPLPGSVGALRALVIGGLGALFLSGITGVVVGLKAYAAGREKERLVQTEIIGRMVAQHQKAVGEANAKVDTMDEAMRLLKQGADHARELERSRNAATLAAVNADRVRLRDQLADAAAGGVQAADDTVAACRDRAAALGRVLDEALSAHAECTAAAEENATGLRTLQRGWPSVSAEPVMTEAPTATQ